MGASYYDPGTRSHKSQKNSCKGVCSLCGKLTVVSKQAWFRASRPRCSSCGGYLDPSENLQQQEPGFRSRPVKRPEARCSVCRCTLRTFSVDSGCRVCSSEACRKLIEILVEDLCSPQGLVLRGGTLDHLGGGRYRFTGDVRRKFGRDFEPVAKEFQV